jgi:hypothetical protein
MFSNKVIRGEEDYQSSENSTSNSPLNVELGLKNVNISIKDYVDWSFWIIFLSSALIF